MQLPRAMIIATFANGVLGVVMVITFCFCVTNLEATVNSDSDFPIIRIVHDATGSYAGACLLGSLLLVLLYFSTVTTVASSSRQVWAFSRDRVRPQEVSRGFHELTDCEGLSILQLGPSSPSRLGHSPECCESTHDPRSVILVDGTV